MHIPFGALVPPLPPQSKSITLSSHLSPLIGLFLSCPPSKYWPSYMADCRMTMRSESPVPPSVHVHVHSEKDTIRGGRSGRERTPVAWLSAKPLRLRRRLKPALLENNALVENRDLRRRGLWIFLFASLSLSLKRKKKNTSFSAPKSHCMELRQRRTEKIWSKCFNIVIWSHSAHLYAPSEDSYHPWVCFCFFCSASLGDPTAVRGIDFLFPPLPTCELRLSAPLNSKGRL